MLVRIPPIVTLPFEITKLYWGGPASNEKNTEVRAEDFLPSLAGDHSIQGNPKAC